VSAAAPQTLPAGFSPAKATDAELAAYGIPPRPRSNAELQQKWQDAFGGPIGVVAARLVPSSRMRSRPHMPSVINGADSNNWSGVVVTSPAGDTLNVAIIGVFGLPRVVSLGAGQQLVATWIGIDGHSSAAPGLLQAGVSVTIDATGAAVYSAWAEWLSDSVLEPPQEISNFPVSAGDSVEVQIWMTSATTALAVMRNLSSNAAAAPVIVSIANSADLHIAGLTAEWIVERPTLASGALATLADYSTVVFNQALAFGQSAAKSGGLPSLKTYAGQHGFGRPAGARAMAAAAGLPLPVSLQAMLRETATVYPGSGATITMAAANGTTLSTAAILANQSLQCQYVGPQPS
jgi:hypothetical protein